MLLKHILKKINAIEDHVINLDVKMNSLRSTSSDKRKVIKLGHADMDQLKEWGLPSESEAQLDNLDKKLNTDPEFKRKLVS